jgi:serine/threonine-protein kinase
MGKGYCILCQRKGEDGELCSDPNCFKRGYHIIPFKYLEEIAKEGAEAQLGKDSLIGLAISKYLIVKSIGGGGMGSIYLALQKPLLREVAIKIVKQQANNPTAYDRFKLEARAIAMLIHPNIVMLYDFGVGSIGGMQNVPFMVTEYVDHAVSLEDLMMQYRTAKKNIPSAVIQKVFSQILYAMEAAHTQGLVHRDLKMENILIKYVPGYSHLVKILDFGLVKALENIPEEYNVMTQTGVFIGTPHYAAPEQIQYAFDKEKMFDHRVDLYAVGMMLFQIITGETPFQGIKPLEIIRRKMDPNTFPFSAEILTRLPAPLSDFFKKAIAFHPEKRFASAEEMRIAMTKLFSQSTG